MSKEKTLKIIRKAYTRTKEGANFFQTDEFKLYTAIFVNLAPLIGAFIYLCTL